MATETETHSAPAKVTREMLAAPVKSKTTLASILEAMRGQIEQVLPRHLTPERMLKMALVAASRTPKLYQCTGESVCKAIMTASELGLDCSGTLGSGYLVPYGSECQFIPGYRGLIDLARRSGQISTIRAEVVREGDAFKYTLGLDPGLQHEPKCETPDPKGQDITHAYGVAKLRDGETQFVVMTRAEVEMIRKRSKAGNNGPWVTDWPEMAKKTVIRRLCKMLPLSVELEKAIQIDAEVEESRTAVIDARDFHSGTEGLKERLGIAIPPAAPEPEPEPEPEQGEEIALPTGPPADAQTIQIALEILFPRLRPKGMTKDEVEAAILAKGIYAVALEAGMGRMELDAAISNLAGE